MRTLPSLPSRPCRLLVVALAGVAAFAGAQDDPLKNESYILPPPGIAKLVDAPRHENKLLTNLGPDGNLFLIARGGGMPSVADLARPYVNLGGEKIDVRTSRDRDLLVRGLGAYDLYDWRSGKTTTISAPKGARMGGASWSPDGKRIALFCHYDDATHVYIAEASTGALKRVSRTPINASLVSRLQWAGNSKIAVLLVAEGRGATPVAPAVPPQPNVKVALPTKNPTRTYRALLETTYDQQLFVYLATAQLALLDANGGSPKLIGKPDMIRAFDTSPDGRYFRVTTILKPFSYIVPASSFGSLEELWDDSGKVLAELEKRPLRQGETPATGPGAGAGAGANQKRLLAWRPDGNGMSFLMQEPAARAGGGGEGGPPTLPSPQSGTPGEGLPEPSANLPIGRSADLPISMGFPEPSDNLPISNLPISPQRGQGRPGGAAGAQEPGADRKDRVMQWLPPFGKDDVKQVYENDVRIGSVRYSADMQTLFLTETRGTTETVFAVKLAEPGTKLPISTRKTDDFYDIPGDLMMRDNVLGASVVREAPGGGVYLAGTQYGKDSEKEAPRPFIDAAPLGKGEKVRVWQSSADVYETVSAVLGDTPETLLLTRQSPTMQPDSYLRDKLGTLKNLTNNRDFAADVTQAPEYRFRVKRADGFEFWVTARVPKYHLLGNKLPTFFWFYPREYTDQKTYDQGSRTFNKNSFPNMGASTKDYLVTLGYAVVEPDCPIIGEAGKMNDLFHMNLRMNLAATIDELERRGISDRDRLAIGGHSYGAFGTAHAMIHTPYFKAGIAGHGNYNRTLTPMAFQSEQRYIWDAREMYTSMSALMFANQLTGALLMYHGMDDQNVGTDPINSDRMYQVLEGLGKPAALYKYPYEDHGPVARETLLDMWARWVAWLEKYLK